MRIRCFKCGSYYEIDEGQTVKCRCGSELSIINRKLILKGEWR